MSDLKRTPLYGEHVRLGGRLIDFGGWELPVQYTGILNEHRQVREAAGLFDVSHMGEFILRGPGAEEFVQYMITNDIRKIAPGQVQYSPICRPSGGCVDDLIVYKNSPTDFFIVVNASNTDKDFQWFCEHVPHGLDLRNVSSEFAQLALQGPKAQEILQKLTSYDLESVRFFHFANNVEIAGRKCLVSRTGYTGEDGFEIYTACDDAVSLWQSILACGQADVAPIGLGARDTLRFEAKLPLYGQEIDEAITPLEAGLGWFVRLEKPGDFLGKDALVKQKQNGLTRKLCEFELLGRGIPRPHYKASYDGRDLGFVTTGMLAPTLGKCMGQVMLPERFWEPGTTFEIVIRDKPVLAEVQKGLFYRKKTRHE
ncbi:MAG: glycine cleavage system aminomethyltransferase GcvT [Planctomycetia bacterium]|nr:glycine cleavage system aminomethyltransferase GcvT [Planctomycetia bacterium]